MELCVSGGAVNIEILKSKSRKRSGELGQRALRSITEAHWRELLTELLGAKLDAPYQRKRADSLLLTANAPHAEHRKGICGPSCYALRDLQRPFTLHLGPPCPSSSPSHHPSRRFASAPIIHSLQSPQGQFLPETLKPNYPQKLESVGTYAATKLQTHPFSQQAASLDITTAEDFAMCKCINSADLDDQEAPIYHDKSNEEKIDKII